MEVERCQPTVTHIGNISSLASTLSYEEATLRDIARRVNELHKPGKPQRKKDGSPRPTHDAKAELKQLHECIKVRLLRPVQYPRYLLGGIADKASPRTAEAHARLHGKKRILLSEDIKDFYPSTTREAVLKVWKRFFNFSPEVAELLATLTTYQNELPQGWKTSSYLANLALWDREPDLVAWLHGNGCTYSRFADDIAVSSDTFIDDRLKREITARIYAMLGSCGYRPKRSKHEITPASRSMEVTGYVVNRENPSISKSYRHRVRAIVHNLEHRAPTEHTSPQYLKDWRSAKGKADRIRRHHPREGSQLLERLKKIQPS